MPFIYPEDVVAFSMPMTRLPWQTTLNNTADLINGNLDRDNFTAGTIDTGANNTDVSPNVWNKFYSWSIDGIDAGGDAATAQPQVTGNEQAVVFQAGTNASDWQLIPTLTGSFDSLDGMLEYGVTLSYQFNHHNTTTYPPPVYWPASSDLDWNRQTRFYIQIGLFINGSLVDVDETDFAPHIPDNNTFSGFDGPDGTVAQWKQSAAGGGFPRNCKQLMGVIPIGGGSNTMEVRLRAFTTSDYEYTQGVYETCAVEVVAANVILRNMRG